jgi:dipeptidyl aminopeptidase/acylaminoacyl peptidase
MHDDVTAGTRALVKAGLADPDRIAIMGTSFGGYLALCGATFEPNVYRCAITVAGTFDWEEMMRKTKEMDNDFGQYGYLLRHLGDPKTQKEKFENMSPLRAVDNITIPIFVAHGRDDPLASVNESKRLIRALEKRHIPFEAMLESGEPHPFAHLEKRVELYTRIEAFLAKHLAAKPGASGKDPLPPAQ